RRMKAKDKILVGWAIGLSVVALALLATHNNAPEPNVFDQFDKYPALKSVGYVTRVVDGDTIDVSIGIRIRLNGIDAPEKTQSCDTQEVKFQCGMLSTSVLRDIVGTKEVSCAQTGTDRYQRVLATCFVDGVDIGEWMVRLGWAIAYRKYSVAYVQAEENARAEKRGIWAGTFLNP